MTNSSATGGPHPAKGTLVLLALAAGLSSVAIHMLVPGLPLLAREFGVSPAPAQYVISIYLAGLTVGQLVSGPMTDHWGRRPVLLGGLAVYCIGAMLGALADTLPLLLAARLLQAFGGAAGLVTSRAIVADLFPRQEAGRKQAALMGITLLSPAFAPVIGGIMTEELGWRPILWLLAAYGLASALAGWKLLPESHRPRAERMHAARLSRSYLRLLRNQRFRRTTFAISGTSCALYMFLSNASFILIDNWGMAPDTAGFAFMAVACGGILGTLSVGWIEQRFHALRTGISFSLLGSVLALLLALCGARQAAALIGPVMLVAFGAGISAPSGIAEVIHSEEGLAGTAASLAGATQMGVAALCSAALGTVGHPGFTLLGTALVAATGCAFFVAPRTAAQH